MSETNKSSVLQSKIITTLKLIEATAEAKKVIGKSYSEQLKTMRGELDGLLVELEEAQRQELDDSADEILAAKPVQTLTK